MQRFTLPLAGGHLAGLNFGPSQGPIDLVFLHATGFNALTYRTLLEPLAPDWRVVALDLRGHGLSTLPAHPARLTHWHGYARDVIQAIGQLAPEGPAPRLIAGHSMGGTVALLALARKPDLAGARSARSAAAVSCRWPAKVAASQAGAQRSRTPPPGAGPKPSAT